ncbi:MAG: c-type cytochrome [Gemmataceae bacterium]
MSRLLLPLALLLALLMVPGATPQQFSPNVVETDPLTPEKEKAGFTVPPGFEVQLVAAEPDIAKPMNLAFDDQGRLWVTDTLEYPFPAKPGVKPRDTVKVLENFGPDGRARKITTFADGFNIPIGLLPLPGARPREALVFGIPSIFRVADTTGRGSADRRDVAYTTYGTRDTHGMTNAFLHNFDGWVYACHGFANQSEVKGADGRPLVMQSGNTYRLRPDGSHLEQFTWGQVNPFGLTVDPLGYFYSSDCHSEPIYQLIRAGYYPSFGKPHDGLGFAPQMFTGYKGSTAVAGIAYYAADVYPAPYRGTAFVGDVMTNQVVQFRFTWEGASPRATQHVLLDSKDRWFRPVDVKLGPDGALYVADFYNRIIGHYEVPLTHPGRDRHRGRIWRIVYTGKDNPGTPARSDWTKATLADLTADLAHPNLVVRLTASHQLAKRGGKEVEQAVQTVARDDRNGDARAAALWVLHRLGTLDEATLRDAATSKTEVARVHLQRILAERATVAAPELSAEADLAQAGLTDASPHVQRAAAEAVGLRRRPAHLRPLVELRLRVPAKDTHLLHTVRIALRNLLRNPATWAVVSAGNWSAPQADALADVVPGVHSPESAAFLLRHVQARAGSLPRQGEFVQYIARFGDEPTLTRLVAFARADQPNQLAHQAALFRAIERGIQERGRELNPELRTWGADLSRKLLGSVHHGEVHLGIELTRVLRLEESQKQLAQLARTATTPAALRGPALDALAAIDANRHAPTLGAVLTDAALPIEAREQAARLLAQANRPLTRAQLVAAMPVAPARLQTSIASALAGHRDGAETLLQAVASGKASARLLQDRGVVVRLEATGLPQLRERLLKLTTGLPPADARLTGLIAERRRAFETGKPDAKRGLVLFEKHCAACHQVAGKGARIGPQLDGIGLRGLDRLLEDTLDPNRNVDEAFRTTRLVLHSGKTVEGLFLREEGAVLVLADAQGKEQRVASKEVESRHVSPLSPMPANLAEQVGAAEFADLLAYLLAQRAGKP